MDEDIHTIFLLQRTSHQNTRTFYDYPNVAAFAQGLSHSFLIIHNHTLAYPLPLPTSPPPHVCSFGQPS